MSIRSFSSHELSRKKKAVCISKKENHFARDRVENIIQWIIAMIKKKKQQGKKPHITSIKVHGNKTQNNLMRHFRCQTAQGI